MASLLFLVPKVKVVPLYFSGPSPLSSPSEAVEGVVEAGEEGRVEERREAAAGQPAGGAVGKGEEEVVGMGGWPSGSSKEDEVVLGLDIFVQKVKQELR